MLSREPRISYKQAQRVFIACRGTKVYMQKMRQNRQGCEKSLQPQKVIRPQLGQTIEKYIADWGNRPKAVV